MPRRALPILILLSMLVAAATGCQPTDPAKVIVDGAEGLIDLGDVPLRSVHRVVFAVDNSSDRPLGISSVRSDCDCIEAIDPPHYLAPNATTDVHVRFRAPGAALSYQTEVILVTDHVDRPFIRLKVKCVTNR